MQTFESAKNEFLLLIGHTSPITHRLAADRLQRMRELAKSAEEIGHVRQATHVWLSTVNTLVRLTKQITDETLPLVVIVKQDMDKGASGQDARATRRHPPAVVGPVCGDCKKDDGFLDDFPFDAAPASRARKVRPSKVMQPGPLEPALDKIRGLNSEDELRAWCVFGESMGADGRIPRGKFVPCPTITASNAAIARMYRERLIKRTWATPKNWDVDTALVEDVTLLKYLIHGEYKTEHIAFEAYHLLPFMRRFGGPQLGFAFTDAHRKLMKAKMIARCKAGTYELTSGWDEKLRPTLLAAWEQARDTDADGGADLPVGAKP